MSGKPSRAGRARLGAIGFTVISVLLAVAAAFVLAQMLKGKGLQAKDMTKIVVAKTDLQPGIPITVDDVELKAWPKGSMSKDRHFSTVEALIESGNLVPFQSILAGEPVMKPRLSNSQEPSGLAPLIDPKMRAFPVKIPRWVAKSKMLYPGAFVDVTATVKLKKGGYISGTTIQRAKVLSVDGAVDGVSFLKPSKDDAKKKKRRASRGNSVVTLMVSPQDAEVLALVSEVGSINLALRGLTDEDDIDTNGVDVVDVFGIPYEEIDVDGKDGKAAEGRPSTAATRAADATKRRTLRRTNNNRRFRRAFRPRKKPKKKDPETDGEFTVGPR